MRQEDHWKDSMFKPQLEMRLVKFYCQFFCYQNLLQLL